MQKILLSPSVFTYNGSFPFMYTEQHRKSEEKFKMSTSEKDETQARVLSMTKERDEFAKLALERGKALEVRLFLNCFELVVVH